MKSLLELFKDILELFKDERVPDDLFEVRKPTMEELAQMEKANMEYQNEKKGEEIW